MKHTNINQLLLLHQMNIRYVQKSCKRVNLTKYKQTLGIFVTIYLRSFSTKVFVADNYLRMI